MTCRFSTKKSKSINRKVREVNLLKTQPNETSAKDAKLFQ